VCPWLNWGTYDGSPKAGGVTVRVRRNPCRVRGGVADGDTAGSLSLATASSAAGLLDLQPDSRKHRQTYLKTA